MFYVTIEDIDKSDAVRSNNVVERLVTVIILDENDNAPVFEDVSTYRNNIICICIIYVHTK